MQARRSGGQGLIERGNRHLETSFLPGRRFSSPADFNAQLGVWLARANTRQHRRLGCRPVDRWAAGHGHMLVLPPLAAGSALVGWVKSVRLPRHQTLTDPTPAAAAAALRAARSEQLPRPSSPVGLEVEQRALDDYDRILGLNEVSA